MTLYSDQIINYYKQYLQSEFYENEIKLIGEFLDIMINGNDTVLNLDDVALLLK